MNKRTGFFAISAAMAATILVGGCGKPPQSNAAVTPPTSASEAPSASAAPGATGTAAAPTLLASASDVTVTEGVNTGLHQNESLKALDINVVTLNGDVRLTGVVDNQAQVDEALKVARASSGAKSVRDELTIKK